MASETSIYTFPFKRVSIECMFLMVSLVLTIKSQSHSTQILLKLPDEISLLHGILEFKLYLKIKLENMYLIEESSNVVYSLL